jgi:hypothetical protein
MSVIFFGPAGMRTAITWIALLLGGATQFACSSPHPFIREGNADTVQVTFAGDPALTEPLARKHCAAYNRVPLFVTADGEIAVYNCVDR